MPNRTVYAKAGDAQLWADAEQLAVRTGRSVSDLIAEGLRLVLDGRPDPSPRPRPAAESAASAPLAPVPNPFAAAD